MTNVCETHSWAQKEPWGATGVERNGENEEERFWVELFSSKNKRWLFPSKQVLETFRGLTPNIKTFFWQKGTWLCSNVYETAAKHSRGQGPTLPPEAERSKACSASGCGCAHRTVRRTAEGGNPAAGPLPALPGWLAAQGGHFHVLWSLQMASQWESPLHAGQMEQQTLVKTKQSIHECLYPVRFATRKIKTPVS